VEIPIEEKYELKLTPIAVAGKKLNLYTIANWDGFVEKLAEKGDDYIEQFPFWVKIWEASIVLADHLAHLSLPDNLEILEIGAGMGVVGLFLGACGHRVTITDYDDDALALLKKNIEYNRLDTVSVERLDWNAPHLTTPYDMIVGSELIYKESFIMPIIALFRNYLRPAGQIFLAHDLSRKCLMQLISMIPGRFEMENVVKTMSGGDEKFRIIIHSLHMK